MGRLVGILSTFFICFLFGCNSSIKEAGPGVSLALAEQRSSEISKVSYQLNVAIPEERNDIITAIETITLDWKQSDNPLVLDFNVPKEFLHTVTVNELDIETSIVDGHISISHDFLTLGENSITLKFQAGESSLNRNDHFLYTLFVPDRASTFFPCFDQPNIKARFSLSLTIPEHWEAIANGLDSKRVQHDGIKELQFAETKPISTYLFAFVAGEFQKINRIIDGREMTMFHRETDSLKVAKNVDEIFGLHAKALNWLEDYTGIPYPFQKFGFVLIPSFQYGGMEHPGAIDYKASSLMLDESATQNQLLGRASVIAHETTHMWFGNMVTMDWFSDVWMKEVFANFMAAKIVNPSFPDINHSLRFLLTHYPAAYAIDRSQGSHPIQQPLDNLKDAGTLYGAIIYQKAPIVMRKLERRIGEELMKEGLRKYLHNYAYRNATWDHLIMILDSLTKDDLDTWNIQWIKQAGMPGLFFSLRTKKDSTVKRLSLYQIQRGKMDKSWDQNLTLKMTNKDSSFLFDVSLRGRQINIDEAVGLHQPKFLLGNAAGYGYGYFNLGPKTKEHLLKNINEFDDPVLRGVGWLNLWESMVHQSIMPEDFLETMTQSLKVEQNQLIIQRILSYLNTLYWKLLTPKQRMEYANQVESLLLDQIHIVSDIKLKAAYFKTYRSIAITEEATNKLKKIWEKELVIQGLELSENDFTNLAYELAIREADGYEDILTEQVKRINNPDRKARMQFVLPALSADQEVRDAFFEKLKDEKNRHYESWVQQAIGFLHHPLRAKSSEKYIRPTLEMLEELQQTGDIFFPKRVLDNTFWGHQSDKAVDDVRQFLYKHNHYPQNLKNKILQSYDMTLRAVNTIKIER